MSSAVRQLSLFLNMSLESLRSCCHLLRVEQTTLASPSTEATICVISRVDEIGFQASHLAAVYMERGRS